MLHFGAINANNTIDVVKESWTLSCSDKIKLVIVQIIVAATLYLMSVCLSVYCMLD